MGYRGTVSPAIRNQKMLKLDPQSTKRRGGHPPTDQELGTALQAGAVSCEPIPAHSSRFIVQPLAQRRGTSQDAKDNSSLGNGGKKREQRLQCLGFKGSAVQIRPARFSFPPQPASTN